MTTKVTLGDEKTYKCLYLIHRNWYNFTKRERSRITTWACEMHSLVTEVIQSNLSNKTKFDFLETIQKNFVLKLDSKSFLKIPPDYITRLKNYATGYCRERKQQFINK